MIMNCALTAALLILLAAIIKAFGEIRNTQKALATLKGQIASRLNNLDMDIVRIQRVVKVDPLEKVD